MSTNTTEQANTLKDVAATLDQQPCVGTPGVDDLPCYCSVASELRDLADTLGRLDGQVAEETAAGAVPGE